jgi:hypothetical protein
LQQVKDSLLEAYNGMFFKFIYLIKRKEKVGSMEKKLEFQVSALF